MLYIYSNFNLNQNFLNMENQTQDVSVMSVKDWIITILIISLPIIGLIMLFVWGFGSGANQNKANFAKAALVWAAIWIGLYIIFMIVFGAAILSSMGNM